MRQVRAWAVAATRGGAAMPRRSSEFDLRNDVATMTLTVETSGRVPVFTAKLWDTLEEHSSAELGPALVHIHRWCEAAIRR